MTAIPARTRQAILSARAKRTVPAALSLAALLLAAGCSGQRVIPAPRPAPAPEAQPAPPPPPSPALSTGWQQAPQTPGEWTWTDERGQSVARFAGGAFAMWCDRATGSVLLSRAGGGNTPVPVTIRTSAMSRAVSASPDGKGALSARLSANDPLLDAMAFSRGRFAVEAAALPVLIVPSWTEASRVIEDCR